jgi:hypothetical protein
VESVAAGSVTGDAGLRRPVLRSESDPLPLWLASVVIEPDRLELREPEWSAETPETDNSTRERLTTLLIGLLRNFGQISDQRSQNRSP